MKKRTQIKCSSCCPHIDYGGDRKAGEAHCKIFDRQLDYCEDSWSEFVAICPMYSAKRLPRERANEARSTSTTSVELQRTVNDNWAIAHDRVLEQHSHAWEILANG